MWTIAPIVLYNFALIATACRVVLRSRRGVTEEKEDKDQAAQGATVKQQEQQQLRFADVKAAMINVTELALGLVSLIHTLICVRIFQMFDCTTADYGEETGGTINAKGKRHVLSVDYSLT